MRTAVLARAQNGSISKKIEEVRITLDRMVADVKGASAGREDKYWQDARYYKDIQDKLCKVAAQPESKRANPARIASMIGSIQNAETRLRTVTTDAASKVERRSNVNDALKAALTKRLEKEDLELSKSIYQTWTGNKDRRIRSAQSLDYASLQFAQSK